MLDLRTKKFPSGDSVKARLKSGVAMSVDAPSSFAFNPDGVSLAFPGQLRYPQGNGKKTKKKKNANKSRPGQVGPSSQNKNAKGKSATSGRSRSSGNKQKKAGERQSKDSSGQPSKSKKSIEQSPPTLGEEQFPALPTDEAMSGSGKFQVEKVPEHRPEDDISADGLEKNRGGSDTASTATTSSSSSSSKQASFGGYAAALLKAAPPVPKPQLTERASAKDNKTKPMVKKGKKQPNAPLPSMKKEVKKAPVQVMEPVKVEPPTWGGGRSFADILRKEGAAVAAEQ